MASVEIPLRATPERFTVSLLGVSYGFQAFWCDPASVWVINLSDGNGAPLVNAIPLITGADLLEQFRYLGIGGQLFVIPSQPTDEQAPGFTDLGSAWKLIFVPS